MLIECTIRRKNGTRVRFDPWPNENLPDAPTAPAAEYHFKPTPVEGVDPPDYPHVAEVGNSVHAARFLSIVEGYRIFGDNPTLSAPPPAAPTPPAQPNPVRNLSVRDLKAHIGQYSEAELRAALAEERASPDSPRKSWCDVVEAHLGVAEVA